jgi:hypothetical protein
VRYDDRGILLALLKSLREVDERCYGDVLSILALKIDLFHTSELLGLMEPLTLSGLWGEQAGTQRQGPTTFSAHQHAPHERSA